MFFNIAIFQRVTRMGVYNCTIMVTLFDRDIFDTHVQFVVVPQRFARSINTKINLFVVS